MGFNYNVGEYEAFRAQHPQQPMLGRWACYRYQSFFSKHARSPAVAHARQFCPPPIPYSFYRAQRPLDTRDSRASGVTWQRDVERLHGPERLRHRQGQGLRRCLRHQLPALVRATDVENNHQRTGSVRQRECLTTPHAELSNDSLMMTISL
jgi:hypothetical protein